MDPYFHLLPTYQLAQWHAFLHHPIPAFEFANYCTKGRPRYSTYRELRFRELLPVDIATLYGSRSQSNHIYIGDGTMIAPNVTILTASHPLSPRLRAEGYVTTSPLPSAKTYGSPPASPSCPAYISGTTPSSERALSSRRTFRRTCWPSAAPPGSFGQSGPRMTSITGMGSGLRRT